jgi:hypothetical protein
MQKWNWLHNSESTFWSTLAINFVVCIESGKNKCNKKYNYTYQLKQQNLSLVRSKSCFVGFHSHTISLTMLAVHNFYVNFYPKTKNTAIVTACVKAPNQTESNEWNGVQNDQQTCGLRSARSDGDGRKTAYTHSVVYDWKLTKKKFYMRSVSIYV